MMGGSGFGIGLERWEGGGYCNVMWVGIICMLRVSYNPVVVCWPGYAMVLESKHRDAWVIG